MKPIDRFLQKPKSFWASVRSLSQHIGYSKGESIIVPSADKIAKAFDELGLNITRIISDEKPTPLALEIIDYYQERATVLEKIVKPNLMTAEEAKIIFFDLKQKLNPRCPIPMNKQKGDKRAEAYLTGIVNILIEHYSNGEEVCFDPRELTTITRDGEPLRTLARQFDGAFPTTINPVAVWEIKEYYYTTTFGSRVANGVYETLLDGMELEELREHEKIDVKHYLMVDAYGTWWNDGKPYLCRMFDMLHMGYVDEILFGKEIINEMPRIVKEWSELVRHKGEIGLPETL